MTVASDERGVTRPGRAAPLPPDERRRAILDAVRPLVLARGASVTTKELAQAAGVAEGTLFRVFADKTTLVRDVVHAAIDPASAVPELDAIDRSSWLEHRLTRVFEIGFEQITATIRWVGVLHELARDDTGTSPTRAETGRAWIEAQQAGEEAVRAALTRVLEPDADRFGRPLADVVELLDVLIVGASMQAVNAARRGRAPTQPPVAQLVDTFLHGVLAKTPTRSS